MNSIRTRLLFWLIGPLTLVAAVVALETFFSARRTSNDLHDRTLFAVMLTVSENVAANDGDALQKGVLEVLTDNLGDRFFYYVSGPNNSFVTGYTGRPKLATDVQLEVGKPYFFDAFHQGVPVRAVAMRRLLRGNAITGLITITTWQRISQRQSLTLTLFTYSLLRLVILTICAGLIVWFAVSRGLRPVENLRTAIAKRTPYDLTPIKREMPQELHGIVGSMNDLLARVARSKANRERFVGDAAHQLRNPIAALKTQAETALLSKGEKHLRDDLGRIVDTTNQTGRMVEQMLISARANALEIDATEPFDLTAVVGEAARASASAALAKGQDYAFDGGSGPLMVSGNRVLVQEAVTNLIDNAIRHSPQNGSVSIFVVPDEDKRFAKVSVADSGSALSEDELLRLSQPFATGEARTSGSGLGLSIAKDVARAHGGQLSTAEQKGGKEISITLALAGKSGP